MTLEHGGPDLGAEIRWDFSTNANPMGPMAGAMHALAEADRRTYPEPTYLALRTALSGAGLGPVDRLLPPEQEALIHTLLTLKLEGARLALLRQEAGSYRDLVEGAQTWLDRYYLESDARVLAAKTELQRLGALNLNPALPLPVKALQKLRALNPADAR